MNLREENIVSESNPAEFKMAAIINLSQNEWVKVFLCKWWEPILTSVSEFERKKKMAESKIAEFKMEEFKMAAIIKLSQNEQVKFFCANSGWIQSWQSVKES